MARSRDGGGAEGVTHVGREGGGGCLRFRHESERERFEKHGLALLSETP